MKYLCLIYSEEKKLASMPGDEIEAIANGCQAHCESLKKSGHLLASARLNPVQTASTVRIRNGKPSITDGPFAETKEQLCGFYLIEARDLNEAIRIASNVPPGRLGCVEVRPLREIYPSSADCRIPAFLFDYKITTAVASVVEEP